MSDRIEFVGRNRPRCAPGQHDFRVVLVARLNVPDHSAFGDQAANGLAFACSLCGERG